MSIVYAYRSLDCFHKESTSGGAFTKIVYDFYAHGGNVVYGAVLNQDLTIKHERATDIEGCYKFRKSKYVKSDITGVFQMVENDIKNKLCILFTGTPCQVYALYKYLENRDISTASLFTVDVICNGAPSSEVWKDYVKWVELVMGKKLQFFDFRKKGNKYNPYLTEAIFTDGTILIDSPKTACWNRLFLKKLIIPHGCFNCRFKSERRISDITLGDFWGCQNIFNNKYLKEGVSLVLINTEKGKYLFEHNTSDENAIIEQCTDRQYIKYQGNLRGISIKPKVYEQFWDEYKLHGIGYVLNKYADAEFPRSMKYKLRKYYRYLKGLLAK